MDRPEPGTPHAAVEIEDPEVPLPRRAGDDEPTARRVVVLSAVYPYPMDGGNKVVLAGLIQYFADRFGAGNVHYVLVGAPPDESGPHPEVHLHVVPRPGTATRLWGVATRTVLGGHSFQESLLWSTSTRDAVGRVLASIGADVVVVDTVRMAQYLDALPATTTSRVCYVDDLYSERYRSLLSLLRERPEVTVRPLASFAPLVPGPLRRLTEWRPTQRAILTFEAARVARSEERVAREFDLCLLANENEAARLSARVPGADVRAIAPLPQSHEPSGVARHVTPDEPVFVIMGVLSGPHNDLAVRWLIGEVLPHLLARVPHARIDVIGKSPSPEVRSLVARHPASVRLLGFVPDPTPHLTRACALLNPPWFASGIKLKVLDALALGIPVVSTAAGVDGVRTGADNGILVADAPDAFADAMQTLCDPEVNAAVSAAARHHSATAFSQEAVFDQYDGFFAADGSARTPSA